ncbi:hypothetical protein HYC85_020553 [Camellia sinensis]|uniref:DRBM domain-containing protein n=1 Tax=Camellia sinensis TaxID=4442 RepID=A0A7J7GSL3_CAMSI|nr:hypothetical protein HYC85_020553 [Camellia sinensis]
MFSLILLDPPELAMYKNPLQEYTQKSSIPLPVYETIIEGGVPHEPRFRSTVRVDGASYTSHDVFSQRKAAEQDVAKVALDGITQKILIREEQGRDERSLAVQSCDAPILHYRSYKALAQGLISNDKPKVFKGFRLVVFRYEFRFATWHDTP